MVAQNPFVQFIAQAVGFDIINNRMIVDMAVPRLKIKTI